MDKNKNPCYNINKQEERGDKRKTIMTKRKGCSPVDNAESLSDMACALLSTLSQPGLLDKIMKCRFQSQRDI